MKKVTFTMPYDDLSKVLNIMEDWLKNNEDKTDEKKVYYSLINVWGDNADANASSDFDPYTVQTDFDLGSKDFNALIMCSFRYALGRTSYMPSWISDIISANKDKLTTNTLNIIIEEITTAHYYGEEHDKRMWLAFKKELEDYREERLLNE